MVKYIRRTTFGLPRSLWLPDFSHLCCFYSRDAHPSASLFSSGQSTSALISRADSIPVVLALVIAAIIAGSTVSRTNWYIPWTFVAPILMSTGSGLMTTFELSTGQLKRIARQVRFDLDFGGGMQQPNLAAGDCRRKKDTPSVSPSRSFLSHLEAQLSFPRARRHSPTTSPRWYPGSLASVLKLYLRLELPN